MVRSQSLTWTMKTIRCDRTSYAHSLLWHRQGKWTKTVSMLDSIRLRRKRILSQENLASNMVTMYLSLVPIMSRTNGDRKLLVKTPCSWSQASCIRGYSIASETTPIGHNSFASGQVHGSSILVGCSISRFLIAEDWRPFNCKILNLNIQKMCGTGTEIWLLSFWNFNCYPASVGCCVGLETE